MKAGWEVKSLGDLCDILDKDRRPITKKDRCSGPYPYYGATGIVDYVDGYLFDEPLVLLGEDGAKWESGEKSAFAINGKTWVNNHAHVIRPNREKLLDSWLIYYLNFADLSDFITGVTVPKLNQFKMKSIKILVPPLAEQQQIVEILDEAFAGLETARANVSANLENSKELFQSVLDENLSGNWETRRLGEIFDVGSSKRVLKKEWQSGGVPFYRGREITKLCQQGEVDNDLFITEEHYQSLKRKYGVPTAGDIMITAIGTIGSSYIVRDGDRFYFKDGSVLWMKKNADVSSEYVNYWISSDRFKSQLDKGNGATVDTLIIKRLASMSLDFPPLTEQKSITEKLDALRTKTDRLQQEYSAQLANLDDLRQSLLQKAFAGELT